MAIPRYATLRAVKRLYANVQIMLKGDCPGWSLNQGARVVGAFVRGGAHVRGALVRGRMSCKRYKRQNLAYYSTEY